MSARDVIANAPSLGSYSVYDHVVGPRVGRDQADAILSALDDAGFAVVPKSLLAKVQNDPPMTGLAQFDLTAKGIET